MPLTAINWDNEIVLAQDLDECDRDGGYYCKHCGSGMRLVLPKKNIIKHFRHEPGSDCEYASESIKHLEAKMFFYNTYLKKYPKQDIELEKRGGDRIGDLIVGNTVIEIQNSSISENEIDARFNDWNNAGYQMLWIITDNVISPDQTEEKRIPSWVRKLHKIYMGRVYMYSDNHIYTVHFYPVYRENEWGECVNYVKTIKNIGVKRINKYSILKTTSCASNLGKIYKISRFYDKAWWV